jgi:hypothetical protein
MEYAGWYQLDAQTVQRVCGFRVPTVGACVIRIPNDNTFVVYSTYTEDEAKKIVIRLPTGGQKLNCIGEPETLWNHEVVCHGMLGYSHPRK